MWSKLLVAFTAAVVCFAESTTEKARAVLEAALADHNPETRKQAVIAFSLAGPHPQVFKVLEDALADKDIQVRLAAISSLVDLHAPRTRELLRKALKDDVPEVSFAAAKALYGLHDPEGREALLSVLAGETKTSSNYLTRQMRDAMRMMHTPHTMFLFAVSQGAGFVPLPGFGTGVSSMQNLLADSGTSGRATAALLLGRERNPKTLQALLDSLEDKDWSVRAASVHALALRNDPGLEPSLIPLMNDNKEGVRLRASAACLRLEMLKTALRAPHRSQKEQDKPKPGEPGTAPPR